MLNCWSHSPAEAKCPARVWLGDGGRGRWRRNGGEASLYSRTEDGIVSSGISRVGRGYESDVPDDDANGVRLQALTLR
jgi:hypothetical protein